MPAVESGWYHEARPSSLAWGRGLFNYTIYAVEGWGGLPPQTSLLNADCESQIVSDDSADLPSVRADL